MSPSFVEHFARNLGVSTAEAERALSGVAQVIRARLDEEEQVHIDGLGTFRQVQEGVDFEPEESLDHAVNLRYAGLPVVELPPVPAGIGFKEEPSREPAPEDPFAHVHPEPHLDLTPEEAEDPLAMAPLRDLTSSRDAVGEQVAEDNSDGSGILKDAERVADDTDDLGPGDDHDLAEPTRAPEPHAGEEQLDDGEGEPALRQPPVAAAESAAEVDFPAEDIPEVDFAQEEVDFPEEEIDFPEEEVDFPEEEIDFPEEEIDFPEEEVPDVESLGEDTPEVDLPAEDTPEVDLPAEDTPEVDLPAEDTPEVDLPAEDAPEEEDVPAEDIPDEDDSPEDHVPEEDVADEAGAGEDDDIEALLAGVWTPRMEPPSHEHPLGPAPPEFFEEADFHVVESDRAETSGEETAHAGAAGRSEADAGAYPPTPPPPGPPRPETAATGQGVPDGPVPPPRQAAPAFVALRDLEDQPRRRLWPILAIAAVALLATAGLVYYALWAQPEQPVEPEAVAEAPAPPVETPARPGPEAPPVRDTAPVETPLMSADGVDPALGGFTWAISEPSAAEAQRHAQRYRQQGYRISVLPATVGGTTFHRVAIGQFETRAEALRHRDQLPEDVPQDIWILAL